MGPLDLVATATEPRDVVDYWNRHTLKAVVWPKAWSAFVSPVNLRWQSVKFDAANKNRVSTERGLYAFVIQIQNRSLPAHGYIAYVGESGNKSAKRNIQKRFADYIADKRNGSKRPKVKEMFDLWGGHLAFFFAPVPDKAVDIKKLQDELNDAIIPPIVEIDFSADVRKKVKAFRAN